jgi:type III secretion protein L
MLTWFTPGHAGVASSNGIVRAREVGTVMDVVELLRTARHERDAILAAAGEEAVKTVDAAQRTADEVIAQARQEASQLLADAQRQALAEVERGYADGQKQAVEQWHQHHAQLLRAQDKVMSAPEQKLGEIVVMAVQRIIHVEPPDALWRRALQTVQELLQRRGTVTLRVAADDAAHARAAVAGWPTGEPSNGLSVEVRADPTLERGACVFESELGTLDASLDIQLAGMRSALARAVIGALAADDGDDGPDHDPYQAPGVADGAVDGADLDELMFDDDDRGDHACDDEDECDMPTHSDDHDDEEGRA